MGQNANKVLVLILFQKGPIKLGIRQFGCPFCTKIMDQYSNMRRHILTHTGEKPFSCPYCVFACNQNTSLKAHIHRMHQNLFSNVKIANKKYFYLIIFQISEPIRIGPSLFGCPYCPKTMKMKTDVKRHILIHTGEKPFSCLYCSYSCNRKTSMKSHMQTTHEIVDKPYFV